MAPEAAYSCAGLALNVAAFCLAALCLHRLSLRVLAGSSVVGSSRGGGAGGTPPAGAGRRRSARLSSLGAGPVNGSRAADEAQGTKQQAQHGPLQARQGPPQRRSAQEQQLQGQGERAADLALLFFCCNPASVFYSAAYSEALFAAASWAGLLLLPRWHWAGVAALAAASAMRSNGILAAWFPLHKALAAAAAQRRLPLRETCRAVLSCAAILAPYAAMQGEHWRKAEASAQGGRWRGTPAVAHASVAQPNGQLLIAVLGCTAAPAPLTAAATTLFPAAQAYWTHCGAAAASPLPPWCSARVASVYAFIQREYWDVGLLRFYRDPRRVRAGRGCRPGCMPRPALRHPGGSGRRPHVLH